MKIGYACLTVGVPGTQHRTCAMKSVTPDVLEGLIQILSQPSSSVAQKMRYVEIYILISNRNSSLNIFSFTFIFI